MTDLTRRAFLRRSAGVAAGAAAAAAVGLPEVARAAARPRDAAEGGAEGDAGRDAVVAYVRPGTGRVTLMVGEREVVAEDRDLARRIRRAAR
jgi:phosphodiesterase/alkaline phosphatase D-like protein